MRQPIQNTLVAGAILGASMLFAALNVAQAAASEIILAGNISSAQKQIVNAPRSSRWQIQIQWMAPEGEIVNKGDLIVVFDGANEQARLEQNQEQVERLLLELTQLNMEQDQKVTDAQGKLTLAKLRVDKARIEASVPASDVSLYDKGQYDLALQRALLEQVKAEEAFKRAQKERATELTKKQLDIQQTKEEITYLADLLTKLSVRSDFSGPVSYAMHPWSGKKLAAGANIQASWKVLDVQSTDNFQIETWIHEVDAVGLNSNAPVELVIDAYPNERFAGEIVMLSSQSEKKPLWSKSAYYPAIIAFEQAPNIKLMPGMSVRVHVNSQGNNNG